MIVVLIVLAILLLIFIGLFTWSITRPIAGSPGHWTEEQIEVFAPGPTLISLIKLIISFTKTQQDQTALQGKFVDNIINALKDTKIGTCVFRHISQKWAFVDVVHGLFHVNPQLIAAIIDAVNVCVPKK